MRRKTANKKIVILIMCLLMVISIIPVNAESKQDYTSLTIDDAVLRALNDTSTFKKMDLGYKQLKDGYEKAKEASEDLEDMTILIEAYEQLIIEQMKLEKTEVYTNYENLIIQKQMLVQSKTAEVANISTQLEKNLTLTDEERVSLMSQLDILNMEIMKLQSDMMNLQYGNIQALSQEDMTAIVGNDPDKIDDNMSTLQQIISNQRNRIAFMKVVPPWFLFRSKEDEYNNIVKARDILWYSLKGEVDKFEIQKEKAEEGIESGVRGLFNGIIQMEKLLEFNEEIYKLQTTKLKNTKIKLQQNEASELECLILEQECEKLQLQIEQSKLEIENMKLTLKKMMGMKLTENIVLEGSKEENSEVREYNDYLENALKNRDDIRIAEIDFDVAKREFDISSEYLEEDDIDFIRNEQAYNEKKKLLEKVNLDIEREIYGLYTDMVNKKNELELATLQYDKACNDLMSSQKYYEEGLISKEIFLSAQIGEKQSLMQLEMAKISFTEALNTINTSAEFK